MTIWCGLRRLGKREGSGQGTAPSGCGSEEKAGRDAGQAGCKRQAL